MSRIRPYSDDDVVGFFSYGDTCSVHEAGDAKLDDFGPLVGLQQAALLPFDENGETEEMIARILIVGFTGPEVAFVIVNFNDEIIAHEGVRTLLPTALASAIEAS
jgi:hypothetical protein